MKSWLQTLLQVLFFLLFSRLSDTIVRLLHVPVPGSIVGLLLLFALLKLQVIRLQWIELGASWLLAEMLLFFIPATVGIIQFKPLILHSGLAMAGTIVCSTIVVMLSAGWIGEQAMRRRKEGSV